MENVEFVDRMDRLRQCLNAFYCIFGIVMPERKMWTEEEDRVLRHLVEERGITRWADLPRIMEEEFAIAGRNGKQCRERYFPHHIDTIITWLGTSTTQSGPKPRRT